MKDTLLDDGINTFLYAHESKHENRHKNTACKEGEGSLVLHPARLHDQEAKGFFNGLI